MTGDLCHVFINHAVVRALCRMSAPSKSKVSTTPFEVHLGRGGGLFISLTSSVSCPLRMPPIVDVWSAQ